MNFVIYEGYLVLSGLVEKKEVEMSWACRSSMRIQTLDWETYWKERIWMTVKKM
jgi:hypothetical protein